MAVRARVRAPELDPHKTWFNTPRPLSMAELRGKPVLLDFWTFCCINCLHVLPDLRRLEEEFGDRLAVIGVHTAKFPHERQDESIRQAILRYQVRHPVVNDYDFAIWQSYAVKAWPTLVLIDPEGYIEGYASGEGNYPLLEQAVRNLLHGSAGRPQDGAPRTEIPKEAPEPAPSSLRFPGKVLADEQGQRLFIADSGHNRIVVADLQGKVEDIIGGGQISSRDGAFETSGFSQPQGMALGDGALYVADTGNHLIRRCDLRARRVDTVAGTGEQSLQMGYFGGGAALQTPLNSPWDLAAVENEFYIAMAGPHQIWFFDPASGQVGPYAGSSREGCIDGLLHECALAQPSGLVSDGEFLFVADSEVSAVRSVPLDPEEAVETLVGVDLFQYGDKDGKASKARLQHPLGLSLHRGMLLVADTYNHKIKILDPMRRRVRTLAGTGQPGFEDGRKARFSEPSGLSVAGDRIFIADTNNHAIRVSPLSRPRVSTLALDFGSAAKVCRPSAAQADIRPAPPGEEDDATAQKPA